MLVCVPEKHRRLHLPFVGFTGLPKYARHMSSYELRRQFETIRYGL